MHEEHRRRMYEKLKTSHGTVPDHEILEAILYNALPRIDTNPIAHRLIDSFQDVRGVFSASREQLQCVQGVGEKTAQYLVLIGEMSRRIESCQKPPQLVFASIEIVKKFVAQRFRELSREKAEIYFVNKNFRLLGIKTMEDNRQGAVSLDSKEIAEALIAYRPYGVFLAHNHPSGNADPSSADDRSTGVVAVTCYMQKVNLLDHFIYTSNAIYSYKDSNRLNEILEKYVDLYRKE